MPRAPFAWSLYKHRVLPLSAQRLINCFAEKQKPGAKSELVLLPTPGLVEYLTTGTDPVRGAIEMAGQLYVVSGSSIVRVDSAGGQAFLGSIDNGGRVSMAENGAQTMIVVPETGKGYIVTSSSVTQITDADFPIASSCTFLDGYFVASEAQTGNFHLSALNDGLTWNGDVAAAERSPDVLERCIRVGSVLWLFGEQSAEVWSNVGAADFPFQQVSGAYIDRGTAARDSIAERLGTVFWLGDDKVIYRSDGFQPVRISEHGIEQEIGGFSRVDDAIAAIYEQEGHIFYCLTFPTAGRTYVYDAKEGFWHERESEGRNTWRCGVLVNFAGQPLAGDLQDGRLYILNPLVSNEDGEQIVRVATGVCFHANNKRVFFSRFSAEFERGGSNYASTSPSMVDGDVWLTVSKDGGRTFGPERWRKLGYQGDYRGRVEWLRLGSAREVVFRLQWSDDVRTALIAVNVDAEEGAH